MSTFRDNLLHNADATGKPENWAGGIGTIWSFGNFDGCTVALQSSVDGATWIDAGADTTFTAVGNANFQLGPCLLRAQVTNAGVNTSVTAIVRKAG